MPPLTCAPPPPRAPSPRPSVPFLTDGGTMKTIDKWDDLTKFGIEPLTGESCGLGYRLLCDVTARGKRVLEQCLGLRDLGAQPPWNRGSDADPHVGSVLLAYPLLVPVGV